MAPARTPRLLLAVPLALASLALAPTASAQTCPPGMPLLTAHHYEVGGTTITLDPANLHPGDLLTVDFTLTGCGELQLSFVSYNTTSDPSDLASQTVFSSETGTFGAGDHNLTITVPPCFYQIDFVYGAVIEHFDPAHGVTYHDENRFIDGTTGGAECVTTTTSTSSTTTTTTTKTTTTEIPFFPSGAALVVGVAGAIGGTLFMLRRRL